MNTCTAPITTESAPMLSATWQSRLREVGRFLLWMVVGFTVTEICDLLICAVG